jgi:hypothetical protein
MSIRELLGFQKGAPEQVDVHEGTWKIFGVRSREKTINEEILSGTPSSKCFTHMCKRILGRMRETKITNTELNWLYSALIAKQPIDPTHLMINRWCCGNIEFGRYWFGVLPL